MNTPLARKIIDSGIEWAGPIPSHWSRTRIRFLSGGTRTSFIDGDWIEAPYITNEGVRLLQCGNVGTGIFEEQGFRYVSEETFRMLNCTAIEPNDVLICRLQSSRTILAGRACLAPDLGVPMITSVDNCILKPSSKHDPRYIVYQLSMPAYLSYIETVARGGTRDRISRSMLGSIDVIAPPLSEQQTIAAFLDRKTAQIDAVVAKKQRLIERLQEKRQALICHAVTKGLDPHAPLKDSGIDWLGEIPAHWKVMKLKHWVSFLNNRRVPISSEDRAVLAKEYPYYGASGIIDYVDDYIFDEPLILIGEDGANLLSRSSRLAFIADGKYWVNNHAHILRPKSGCLKFWSERLESISYVPFVTGSAQPKLTIENLANIEFAAPDESEQEKIGQFVDAVNSRIDGPLQKLAQQINKLQEYRQTLISAAVTGKIDVTKEAAC